MTENNNNGKKDIDCFYCNRKYYCMEIISKIDVVLRRMGVMDYNFKIAVCNKFSYEKGGDEEDKHEILKELEEL